jgi:2,3-bisphosphoglycerate-independent phosphoglycerate mutase
MFGIGKKATVKPVGVLVLDGFGLAPDSEGNAISLARTPNFDRMWATYPHGQLIASGESVGLPANEVGNTEVGHLTMGVGRVIYQDLVRIDKASRDGSMVTNEALIKVANHVKQNNSKLHVMGLIGTGKVHSSMEHLQGLLKAIRDLGVSEVRIHAFTDGRDSHPQAGLQVAAELEEFLSTLGVGKMASVMGRYYAMDRDRRWERIKMAYDALVQGRGEQALSIQATLKANYEVGITDEFIKPTLFMNQEQPLGIIQDGDGVVMFNFRVDRPKELTTALVLSDFEHFTSYENGFDEGGASKPGKAEWEQTFDREKVLNNLCVVTMTEYHEGLPVQGVLFGKQQVMDALPAVVAEAGLQHLHMAESEKERFVKYYFNGMREEDMPGQTNEIVKSPRVATYDKKPEMSVHKLSKRFVKQLKKGKYSMFVMNFANPDMVAHTGNVKATIRAIEEVDEAVGRVEAEVLKQGGMLLLTADHGNAEELLTFAQTGFYYTSESGGVNTEHSNNPVPVVLASQELKGKSTVLAQGTLADVAPTLIAAMGLTKPDGMTGRDLLEGVR